MSVLISSVHFNGQLHVYVRLNFNLSKEKGIKLAKCCKAWKIYSLAKFPNFVYVCIIRAEIVTFLGSKMVTIICAYNTNIYKICKLRN
jgi:hypothetical protein